MTKVVADYPYSNDIVQSRFVGLLSAKSRSTLYVRRNNDSFVFENPIYCDDPKAKTTKLSHQGSNMRTKDFLASIPSFADFTDEQLTTLEQKATTTTFQAGEVIFKQGQPGDVFYVINQGTADVLIQDNPDLMRRGDLGKTVNRLTEGCYFGERALMTSEVRAASIRAVDNMVCLVFSRAVYEEVISGSGALLGKDINANVDWSKDHETRSLFKHIENILDIDKMQASPKIKRILYELTTAFTPELSADEVISRMVMTVKIALKVDRVGLFVLSEDKRSMVLKVSERSKGIRLPVRGIAGAVVQTNTAINIADAYQDSRFDATMDRRTGYRTRQVLGVPLKHPLTGEAIGLLQVNNRLDGSLEGFSAEQQRILELAAVQLAELLYGRADVFIHSGGVGTQKSYGQGVGDGLVLLNSSDISSKFRVEVGSLDFGVSTTELIRREGLQNLEVHVSLHLALGQLCSMRKVNINDRGPAVDVSDSPASRRTAKVKLNNGTIQLNVHQQIQFDIAVRDLPRAARLLFQIWGWKKKGKHLSMGKESNYSLWDTPVTASPATNAPNAVFLGWAACTIFDFKGCVDCMQQLHFFPPEHGPVEVPIKTTLSNGQDPESAAIGIVLAPDLVLTTDSAVPRVRIVHSMPSRNEPIEGDSPGGFNVCCCVLIAVLFWQRANPDICLRCALLNRCVNLLFCVLTAF
jgi:CRP-like cAMP-binding protein